MKISVYKNGLVYSFYFLLVALASCSKEYSVENQNPKILATGTLKKDSTGCKPVYVNGTYYYNSFLNQSHYALVQVNVITTGYYTVYTNTSNGFYFIDSGYFNTKGVQQVQLQGVGIPTVPDTTHFSVFFAGDVCEFSVNNIVDTTTTFGNAFFTLTGAPASCSNILITGSYSKLKPADSTNSAIVEVNVLKTGAYNINTNTVNGLYFSKSGTFTKKGIQRVVLNCTGTAQNTGSFTYPVIASTGNCSFSINVQ